MRADRRTTRRRWLVLCLGVGLALSATGCASPSHPAATTSAPRAPTTTLAGASTSAERAVVATCVEAHGMTVPDGATARELRAAFATLPAAQQHSVFAACASLLPGRLRLKLQAQMAEETTTTSMAP